MYHHDQFERQIVLARVKEFSNPLARQLQPDLSGLGFQWANTLSFSLFQQRNANNNIPNTTTGGKSP